MNQCYPDHNPIIAKSLQLVNRNDGKYFHRIFHIYILTPCRRDYYCCCFWFFFYSFLLFFALLHQKECAIYVTEKRSYPALNFYAKKWIGFLSLTLSFYLFSHYHLRLQHRGIQLRRRSASIYIYFIEEKKIVATKRSCCKVSQFHTG